jgi:hypothetical protein
MTTARKTTRTERFAAWVSQRLVVRDGNAIRPPSAKLAWSHLELDGSRLTVVSRGDAFDLFYGRTRPVVLSITPKAALRLAWFILWRWWVLGTFCGLKTRLWNWSLSVLMRRGQS